MGIAKCGSFYALPGLFILRDLITGISEDDAIQA